MRRKDRELAVDKAENILQKGIYGVLSTIGENGFPYGVPMNYAYDAGTIFFHCAKQVGKKLDNLRFDSRVSFTVVGATEILPDKFSTNYESVIVDGRVEFLAGSAKAAALYALVKKYSPEYITDGKEYIQKAAEAVDVGCIRIERIAGKARY